MQMTTKFKTTSAAQLDAQVGSDMTCELVTADLLNDRFLTLHAAGADNPEAQAMRELLVSTSKRTKMKGKPSWAKIATYACLAQWSWDEFNRAMKDAVKLWQPKWDAKKLSSMQGCWGHFKYDPELWAMPRKAKEDRTPAAKLKVAARKMEAALAALDELTVADRKTKEFAEIEAYNRLINRSVTGTVILAD